MQTLRGTVTYREKLTLPPDAILTTSLEDISNSEASPITIARKTQSVENAPPYTFVLEFDSTRISTHGNYNLMATIGVNDQIMFGNNRVLEPFMQDAIKPLTVTLQSTSSGALGKLTLTDIFWKVVKVNGQPVEPTFKDKKPFIELAAKSNRVRGFAGCNTFGGGFMTDSNGSGLTFDKLYTTRMACADTMDFEVEFMALLDKVSSYAISGYYLHLQNSGGDNIISLIALQQP